MTTTNRYLRGDALPLTLGAKIVKLAPPAPLVKPVPGKPHLFVDAQGRWQYLPPSPMDPVVADALTHLPALPKIINAPPPLAAQRLLGPEAIDHTTWKSEPPPTPGWYIASTYKDSTKKRYWTGSRWSFLFDATRITSTRGIEWLCSTEPPPNAK